MKTFKRSDITFPLQHDPAADGLHATFAPDGALTSVEFRQGGKLREALRVDGAAARFETVEHFASSGDYQGSFEGLEDLGVKGDDFDAMEPEAQEKVLGELEHLEFVKDKLEFLARDRTPRFATNCSFCGKSNTEVKKLIAGPAVYICNECVGLCSEIIASEAAPR